MSAPADRHTTRQPALSGDRLRQLLDNLPAVVMMLDRDLRVLAAGGEQLTRLNYEPDALVGRSLDELVPDEALALLVPPYRDALEGVATDFDYLSPVGGGSYHVRARPLRGESGEVVGLLSMTTDLTRQRALEFQLGQARRLVSFGGSAFDRLNGWSADAALQELWGVEGVVDFADAVDLVVHPDDRSVVREEWQSALAQQGRSTVEYRLQRPSGEVRHLHCDLETTLDQRGELIQALGVHLDVTEILRAEREHELRRVEDERQRQLLLRGVTDLLATHSEGTDVLQATADLAVRTLGDGCVIRIASAEGDRIEHWATAHRDPAEGEKLRAWLRQAPTSVDEGVALIREVLRTGEVRAGSEYVRRPGEPPWTNGLRYAAVPAREQGRVLGVLSVFRAPITEEFASLDIDVIQLLADRMAAGFAASQARSLAQREQAAIERLSDELTQLSADQRRLILELDGLEARERERLVEALHDEPLQLVVAALLRLDTLGTSLPDSAGEAADQVATMLETAVAQMRSLIGTTAPADLEAGLGAALEELATATFQGTAVRVRRSGPDRVSLSDSEQDAAYRVMREALVNARKHAEASSVHVEIVEDDERTVLAVTDDGVGPGAALSAPGHIGLASMRARAALVAGQLRMSAPAEGGTRVELELRRAAAPDGPGEARGDRRDDR